MARNAMLNSFIANGMQIPSDTEERAAERACGRFAAGGAANSGTAPTKRPTAGSCGKQT